MMKKNYNFKRRIALAVAFCMIGLGAFAQLPMTRSTFTAPFVPISVAGGATLTTITGDDGTQAAIPIGFTFNYLGTNFTTMDLCANGWASFGAAGANAWTNSGLFTTTTPNNTLAPWWDDLNVGTGGVLYQTQGLAGSQTFTVQWDNVLSYNGSGRTITFKLVLYEGTNVIEFHYNNSTPGTFSTSESASIGIEGATGGPGNFIDAMSGSSFINQSYMTTHKWLTDFIRFTPGAPTAIAGGTYTVGSTGTYPSLSEAVANINHRGINGPVTLSLTDAVYDTTAAGGRNIFPIMFGPVAGNSSVNTITVQPVSGTATLTYRGVASGNGGNQTNATAFTNANEPVVAVVGTDYVTLRSLNFQTVGSGLVDRGLLVANATAIDGAQNNLFENISTTLLRTNTSTIGIQQNVPTAPTAATGANSNNIYKNLTIKNVYAGINLLGNATFPDISSQITTSACSTYNIIGDPATPNDIGNGTAATVSYGISANNQSGFTITNNNIRNVSAAAQVDGITIIGFQGVCTLNNNKIQGIRNGGVASTTGISGIRMTHNTTGTHTIRVFNNAISEITSGYTGAASTARTLKGIFVNGTGGGTTQTYEIYNNNVSIDGSASLNVSSACFEINSTVGPLYKLGNNIFANYTAAQGATSKHFAIVSSSATVFGPAGTTSNNNDFYVPNDIGTSGFVGGAAANFNTLAAWAAAMTPAGMEAASLSVDPLFINTVNDLHATALALNGAGQAPPAYVGLDLDCATRTPDNDMGAYVLAGCAGTPTAGTITGVSAVCSGLGTTLTLTGASIGAGITYQWASSTVSGGPYTTLLGTSSTQATGPVTVPTYYVVGVACSSSGLASATPQYSILVNPLPTVAVTPTTGSICLPGGASIPLLASGATTYSWLPTAGLTASTGASVTANPTGTTTYTVSGTDGNGCVSTATAAITVGASPVINAVTATPPSICTGANSQLLADAASTSGLGSYVFTTGTGATLDPMTGATTVLFPSNDDTPTAAPAAIGFSFPFNGVNYTQYSVSPDGWILLGGATAVNEFTNTVTSGTNIPKIYPMWDDLATGTTGNVQTTVVGTAPNRIFIVQWFVTSPRNTTGAANATFQAWLYETSGVIDFRYGTLAASGSASAGLTASTTNFQSITFTSNTSSNITANNTNATAPASGRIYTYTPATLSYVWSPATFLSSTTIANPMANAVASTTTYTVTAAEGACTSTGTVTLTVGAPLLATTSITPTANACVGIPTTLGVIPSGGGAPYTYSWTGPNSFTSTTQNPLITPTLLDAGTYTVVVTDNCGINITQTATLVVNANPTVTASSTSATYCTPGSAVTLTGSGAAFYDWLPLGGLSASSGTTVDATPSAATTYTVTGTDANGCVGTNTITVNTGTTPIVVASSSPATICSGANTAITAVTSFPPLTYCQPTYSNGTAFGDYISSVQLDTINNITAGAATPFYTLYPASGTTTTTLVAGNTYTITLIAGTYTQNDLAAFIDYNQSGLLNDAGEKLGETDNIGAAPASTSFTFTVPLTALNGLTRLRVREMDHGGTNDIDPCANQSTFGEVEDYIITITGGASVAASYVWSPGTFLGSTTNATENVTAATATTTYTVTTTVAGCSSIDSTTITVNALPVVTATSTAAAVCPGDSVTLTGGGATTYAWDNSVTDGIAFAPTATTTYQVTGTDVNGCTNTASTTVVYNPSPVVTASSDTASICLGGSVTLTGGGASTYVWDNSVTDGVAFAPTATTTYQVTGTDVNGCTNTATTSVTVNALPVVTATSDATGAICAGTTVTLTGGGATTYVWDNSVTDAVGFPSTVTTTYQVTGTDLNGCTNTDTVTVTVNALPTVTATSTASALCAGDSVVLTGGGATTYVWDNSVTDGLGFVPTATTTYQVTGTDVNGCTNTASTTVTVNALPVVTATATSNSICAGSSVTLTGGGATTYVWDNSVVDAVAFTPTATTTYQVTGTDVNGCVNTATTTVTVNPLPIVTFTPFTSPVCIQGGTITLTGGSPAGGTYSGSGVTAGAFNPVVSGLGSIAITYTYSDSTCSNTATTNINVQDCTGIDENLASSEVSVSPNPTMGSFNISINSINAEELLISICDIQGKEVFTSLDKNVNGAFSKQINLEELSKGLYYIKLSTGADVKVQKLIIQ